MTDERAKAFVEDFIRIAKQHGVGLEIYVEDGQGYQISVWDAEDGTNIGEDLDNEITIPDFEGRLRIERPFHKKWK